MDFDQEVQRTDEPSNVQTSCQSLRTFRIEKAQTFQARWHERVGIVWTQLETHLRDTANKVKSLQLDDEELGKATFQKFESLGVRISYEIGRIEDRIKPCEPALEAVVDVTETEDGLEEILQNDAMDNELYQLSYGVGSYTQRIHKMHE